MRFLILVLAAAFSIASPCAQEPARDCVVTSEGTSVYVPAKPAVKQPVLVIAETGARGARVLEMMQAALKEHGLIAVAPTLPVQRGRLDAAAGIAAVERTVAKLKADYGVEPGPWFALSFSASGPLGYQLALGHSDQFAGLIVVASVPASPPGIPVDLLAKGRKLPVLLAHGTDDQMFGPQRGEQAEKVLRDAGYTVKLQIVEGADHMGMVGQHAGEFLGFVSQK